MAFGCVLPGPHQGKDTVEYVVACCLEPVSDLLVHHRCRKCMVNRYFYFVSRVSMGNCWDTRQLALSSRCESSHHRHCSFSTTFAGRSQRPVPTNTTQHPHRRARPRALTLLVSTFLDVAVRLFFEFGGRNCCCCRYSWARQCRPTRPTSTIVLTRAWSVRPFTLTLPTARKKSHPGCRTARWTTSCRP